MNTSVTTPQIIVHEFEESGVFFRNPFYKKFFDVYSYEETGDDAQAGNVYDTRDRKGFYGFINSLLNRKSKVLKIINNIQNNDNICGYNLFSLRSPIYLKRQARTADYISDDMIIHSRGFNYINTPVSGHCVSEKTIIFKKVNHQMTKVFHQKTDDNGCYSMTYKHHIINFLNTGKI